MTWTLWLTATGASRYSDGTRSPLVGISEAVTIVLSFSAGKNPALNLGKRYWRYCENRIDFHSSLFEGFFCLLTRVRHSFIPELIFKLLFFGKLWFNSCEFYVSRSNQLIHKFRESFSSLHFYVERSC